MTDTTEARAARVAGQSCPICGRRWDFCACQFEMQPTDRNPQAPGERAMNPDIVEVTQEDRELFLELFSDDPDDRDGEFTVRDGRWDSDWRMQLLARHRIAALTAARPAIMEPILAALKVVDEAEQPSTWETAVDDLLAAIRAAEVTK